MNISPVSFSGIRTNPKYNRNNDDNTKSKPGIQSQVKKNLRNALTGTALLVMLTNSANTIAQKNNLINVDFENDFPPVSLVETVDVLPQPTMPLSYDYIESLIATNNGQLRSNNIPDDKKAEIQRKIVALRRKRTEQMNVASMNLDGDKLYIQIDFKENMPETLKEKYKYGINIENFKRLFDIKDGAIEQNNDLVSRIEYDPNSKSYYYDYTHNWFRNGKTIVVPIDSINMSHIDLTQYYE